MLHEFLCAHRGPLLARMGSFAAAGRPGQEDEEHETSAPFFLDHLTAAVAASRGAPDGIRIDAAGYCDDGLIKSLPVGQIVRDSSDLRRAIVEVAGEMPGAITDLELHTVSRCLMHVTAHVVGEFARRREQAIHDEQTERQGELVHELRNVLASGSMAFEMLGTGRVAIGGATSSLLGRCLTRLSVLVDTTMARVRLESSVRVLERVSVSAFVDDIGVGASMEARALGITLAVAPVDPGVDVEVDRQLLVAAISNLLQNAFKFSRPEGHVSLRTSPTRDRVLIEVEDECGGLPPGKVDELFRPFEQRGRDRSGLGLGLTISRRSVEAIGGELRVRDIPGTGCAFTINLPGSRRRPDAPAGVIDGTRGTRCRPAPPAGGRACPGDSFRCTPLDPPAVARAATRGNSRKRRAPGLRGAPATWPPRGNSCRRVERRRPRDRAGDGRSRTRPGPSREARRSCSHGTWRTPASAVPRAVRGSPRSAGGRWGRTSVRRRGRRRTRPAPRGRAPRTGHGTKCSRCDRGSRRRAWSRARDRSGKRLSGRVLRRHAARGRPRRRCFLCVCARPCRSGQPSRGSSCTRRRRAQGRRRAARGR